MYGRVYDQCMGPNPPLAALALRAPAIQRSASGIGVSALCGAVSTPGIPVFVPGLSKFRYF